MIPLIHRWLFCAAIMLPLEQEALTECSPSEAYCFVPIKTKLLVLALLRAGLYSRCADAS